MDISRRSFWVATGSLVVGACTTRPPSPMSGSPVKAISLVDAFRGKTIGIGVFRVPITGLERRFKADLVGTVRGNTLTVVEDFYFEDGEVDRLTWRFTRSGSNTWTGKREDTVGLAQVTENGNEIRLEYIADVRSRGAVTRLGFSDVIYRRADGVVVNEAIVTRSGLAIGSVSFELRRH